jgi:glycosyltransferase involved in cell wall biosynthesis
MDVFAFAPAPRGEGISTVVLEAMAVGLPVVTYAVAGLPEAIDDGTDGVLVPLGEWRELGRSVAEVLSSGRAGQLGAAARRKALARFTLSAAADTHVAAYQFAVARSRGGGHAEPG